MSGDTVSELLQEVLDINNDKRVILLLDMRPTVCNAQSTIKTAVSVSVPNMLMKRPMYSLGMVTEQLTTQREVEAFSNWRQFSYIVFFDATGSIPAKGSPILCIAQKFRREDCTARLGYIHGGYNAFAHNYPSLCCCSEDSLGFGQADTACKRAEASSLASAVPQPISNSSLSRSRLHLGPLPNMLARSISCEAAVCQTPMTETSNINPLFESVSQAIGLNTNITEEVPVRLPPSISVESIRDSLPTWLLDAVRDNTGKTELAQRFQKVEVAEKKRLFMVTQEKQSGKAIDLSICAGIEKGLKNRYNIYPFDQTRVKIRECEDGQDDYINASFLRPPFGHKHYIAAQGPLPSTFQDFWKVVWEQNSRVIVMLTREFEMGKIKCHHYWPTSENPVMELGPLRVTFLTDYRPDTTDDSILVRQMQLNHLHYPDKSGRTITQIQYTGWPDFGVPETPIGVLEVIQLANEHNTSPSAGPMVVHCSAGCGRTGTFCVIDSVLAELKDRAESIPNDVVFDTVSRLREQRLCIVQCLRQYVFCYEAILWHLVVRAMRLRKDIVESLKTSVS
ncbi:protein-tyrosine phosphatase-like protein [Dissophora ornata]|nr:protein-tyrosine phosphatase-like protein [Dissophora ornata]